jgi:hypothetical protein
LRPLLAGVALLYCLALSPALAAGLLIAFALLLLVTQWLATLPWPLWLLAAAYRRIGLSY